MPARTRLDKSGSCVQVKKKSQQKEGRCKRVCAAAYPRYRLNMNGITANSNAPMVVAAVIQNGKQHAKAQEGNERMQQEQRHMPPRGVQSEKEVIQVQPRAEQRPIVRKISNQVTSAVNKISWYGSQMSEL